MIRNRNAIRLLCLLCLLVHPAINANLEAQTIIGQRNDSVSHSLIRHQLGFDIRPGYIVSTHSFLQGDNMQQKKIDQSLSFHLKYAFRFSKESNLGRLFPHTYQGIGVSYQTFFSPVELGNPVSVYAFQGSRIAQLSPRLSLDYEWNFGASFGWRKYDELSNPQNVLIGSKINAYINLGFLLNWQVHKYWKLAAGVDLTHFSNGNTHYPNGGLNVIGGRIGIVRTLDADEAPGSITPRRLFIKPHVSYDLVIYGATRKRGLIGDDVSSMIPGSFGVAGINLKEYRVGKFYSGDLKFHRPPFRKQFAMGLSLRAELVMPVFSINVGVGRNLIYSGGDMKGFYQILALKTYVTRHLFLHVGYQLSKFKDPNNLMLGLGYRFHDKR